MIGCAMHQTWERDEWIVSLSVSTRIVCHADIRTVGLTLARVVY